MDKVYSSEGCADAMVADGYAAETANYIDNSVIEQQRQRIAELEAENAALKRDIACRPGTLDLSYRVREALGFNKYYPLSHLDDDVRKLKRVEQEARRLISEGLQNTPDGLIVRENADRSDPHWALCHALDLIEPMNKPV